MTNRLRSVAVVAALGSVAYLAVISLARPFVPGLQREDWDLPDPKGLPPERVRAIRDEIRARVERLVGARGWRKEGASLKKASSPER